MRMRTILSAVALSVAFLGPAQAGGGMPDLAIEGVTPSTAQAAAGQQIAVACDVVNLGVGPAGLSRLKYYFSQDASYDSGDAYLNYDDVDALGATDAGTETANVRIPAGTPNGNYHILLVADFDQAVAEADETNNVFALPISVGAPASGADFVVESPSASLEASAGEVIAASAYVRNLGSATGVETRLKYYLSLDASYGAGDVYLNYDAVDGLGSQAASLEEANLRVPVGTAPGAYFILFVADQTNAVAEIDETNNVAALPLWVGVRPDLTVTASASTEVVRAGESVAVTAVVENVGDAAAPDVTLKYLLSSDLVVDPGDKHLSYDKVDALGVDAWGAEDATLNITTATPAGDYFLLVVADADQIAPEHDEQNNVVALPLSVTHDHPTATLPDLTLSEASLDADHALPGGTLGILVTVENVGVANAGPSRVKYYFSSDDTFDAGDAYLNYDPVEALVVGGTSAETANLTIPSGAPLGPAYILAIADAAADVAERYESDNVTALAFTVGASSAGPGDDPTANAPDLVVSDAWVESIEVPAGERAHLHLTVDNVGVATSGTSQVKYYLSRDDIFDAGDVYASYDSVAALAPGASSPEDVEPLIPADAAGGLWHLLIVVDAKGEVVERHESNNVTAVAIEVVVDDPNLDAADLVVESPSLSKSVVGAGYEIAVSASIENVGTQPAAPSRLKLYLSDDALLDGGDVYLDHRRLQGLDVGEVLPLAAEVRIPASTNDGAYHLLIALDVNGEVVESFESNNVVAVPVAVGADVGPNAAFPYACPADVFVDPSIVPQDTVATFNALHLGWNNTKDMVALACVVSHFDLVGLVEIATPQGLADLESALEALTGEAWSSHLSEWAVGNENGTEFYGYVWRAAAVSMTAALGFYDDVDDDLKREPYGASFTMGSFDFTLVVFHLQYGSSISTRRAEAEHLVDVYDYFQSLNGADDALLIGGDFNLPANDAAFTVLDLRNLVSTTDPEQLTSIGLSGPGSSFDHIFFSPATSEPLASGVLDFTWNNYGTIRDAVSDHLPVWMAFDTTTDND